MTTERPSSSAGHSSPSSTAEVTLVQIRDAHLDGYDGTRLRPLGLCELGGCCEVCWYRPDHPRFRQHDG